MNLSSDLVSQFAKITNPGNDRKAEEVTLYGEIVQFGDALCVKFDGSNEMTPAISTTTIKVGDRVSAVIKNHTAIVTGNFSDPSASSDTLSKVGFKVTEMGVVFTGLEDGTTVINGACIKTGTIDAERINLKGVIKYEFSINGSSDWHETMTASDMYRRDSVDGGQTWSDPYQFRGVNGQNGSDASVPSYVELKGLNFTELTGSYIKSPKIYAGEFYGTEFTVTSDGSNGSFSLHGPYAGISGTKDYNFFEIKYNDNGAQGNVPFICLRSPDDAELRIGYREDIGSLLSNNIISFYGYVDFSKAEEVTGLPARFG